MKFTFSDGLWRQIFTCFTQDQFGYFMPLAIKIIIFFILIYLEIAEFFNRKSIVILQRL